TYPLPEAQIDRFLFKILLTYPPMDQEMDIVDRYAGSSDIGELKKVMDRTDMVRLQELTRMVPISKDLSNYAVQIVGKTRQSKNIEYGASPRASIGLILAAKANALIGKRNYVVKKDIQEMAFPVLRHRVVLSFKAEKEGLKPDDVIKELI
ncbi:MAG: MoxR family ATPase, partial [Candidatus Aenigmarchaeota archaeon]|nr:MoxR family ATPase [Candidatus Aenigmarchaeota archaeon]